MDRSEKQSWRRCKSGRASRKLNTDNSARGGGSIECTRRNNKRKFQRPDNVIHASRYRLVCDQRVLLRGQTIPLPSPVYASVCDRFKSTSACFEVLFIARCASPRHRETPFPNPRLRYAASFAGAGRLPWQVWNRLEVVEKKL